MALLYPGLEIRDPEICRGQTVGSTNRGHRGDKSGTDGTGQRDGQSRHDSSTLEPRSSAVQQHCAVLDGNRRVLVSGSGDERDRSGDDDGTGQHELMYIMHIPDEDARLRALRRYLTATGKSQSATQNDNYGQAATEPRPATVLLFQIHNDSIVHNRRHAAVPVQCSPPPKTMATLLPSPI